MPNSERPDSACDACYGERTDECPEGDCRTAHIRYLPSRARVEQSLEDVKTILLDVCERYGTTYWCQEGNCNIDPDVWEGCLTRKILNILEPED